MAIASPTSLVVLAISLEDIYIDDPMFNKSVSGQQCESDVYDLQAEVPWGEVELWSAAPNAILPSREYPRVMPATTDAW
ncbi:MAG: hypothetical protein AB2693_15660 [Candidatus Thiodiazotropha sp.]